MDPAVVVLLVIIGAVVIAALLGHIGRAARKDRTR